MPNDPSDILSAWTALEVLSPPTFRRKTDLAAVYSGSVEELDNQQLPWESGATPTRGYRFYYQVVLCTLSYAAAIHALLDQYTDSRVERPSLEGEVILAALQVNDKGQIMSPQSVVVSSFGWGFPLALTGKMERLAEWASVEKDMTQQLTDFLLRSDGQGNLLPIDRPSLERARAYLLQTLQIPSPYVTSNRFAIRCMVSLKSITTPDPLILNSFFLGDLAWARKLFADKKAPMNLQRYLGVVKAGERKNLLSDTVVLEKVLAPANFSPARWPGPGRHPLVLLQQAAVNVSLQATPDKGIFAVNGPPGTGKTTLLRDVVAGVIVQRAEALLEFVHPRDAFHDSGEKLSVGQAFLRLYHLDPRLKGHELLIASSNNKAVENVSAELPGMEAIATDATELRYFKTLSDKLMGRDSWGLIAAVLGNASNRYQFVQTFWWDKEVGMATYLSEASGTPQWIDDRDPETDQIIGQRKPRIITAEKPPDSQGEATDRWETARTRFRKALQESRKSLELLEGVRELIVKTQGFQEKIGSYIITLEKHQNERTNANNALVLATEYLEGLTTNRQEVEDERKLHQETRPGFFARLFRTQAARAWGARQVDLTDQWIKVRDSQAGQEKIVKERNSALSKADAHISSTQIQLQKTRQTLQEMESSLKQSFAKMPGKWLDPDFFRQPHANRHLSAPWCDEVIHRQRDEVFNCALQLHKAFIDAAALQIKHNLGALFYVFGKGALPDEKKLALLPDLWSSLFLVVPALSTTFASMERLLGNLPAASLGWLLVDEAGQALPQAAVGAFLRTQKAVIVGDPLQIEPVVVLPEHLTHVICQHFDTDPLLFNAPKASVQTLADAATPYYAEFETLSGSRAVGIPLLVHRRCSEPMFGISNVIAYARLMVQAKQARSSKIQHCLGASQWINIHGTAREKWCPEEGQAVLGLLQQLKAAGIQPDLYIITPFALVANQLRSLIFESRILEGWVENSNKWPYERIGTVHTVQGREAEAVIFVLGAPATDQGGARGWAGRMPNLLNVAVTRAKEVIYVVGNRDLWKGAGVFAQLAERM